MQRRKERENKSKRSSEKERERKRYRGSEKHRIFMYRVMQSDRNSFYGDVVLDSLNKVSRDEYIILDQKYKSKYFLDLYYEDFNFNSD